MPAAYLFGHEGPDVSYRLLVCGVKVGKLAAFLVLTVEVITKTKEIPGHR